MDAENIAKVNKALRPEGKEAARSKDAPRRPKGSAHRRRKLVDLAYSSPLPWGLVFAVGFTVLISPGLRFEPPTYELGDIAPVDIRAPYDFSYEDEVTTTARRDEAEAAVPEVYDFNNRAALAARSSIAQGFELAQNQLEKERQLDEAEREALFAGVRAAFGVALTDEEFDFLYAHEFSNELQQGLIDVVTNMLQREIVENKERLLASGRPILRRDDISDAAVLVRDLSRILTAEEARRQLRERVVVLTDLKPSVRKALSGIAARFIEPTLTFNFVETERRRREAREAVDPVYFQIKKGRIIVRAGDEIDAKVLRQLEVLSAVEGRRWRLAGSLGAFILSGLLLLCLWRLLRPARRTREWKLRSFVMVSLIVVFHLALARGVFFVANAVGEQLLTHPFNNVSSYQYLVPLAAVGILVSLLETVPTALVASVVFAVAHGLMTGNLQLAVFTVLSCVAGILGMFQYKQRTALIKTGLYIGSVNLVVVLAIDLLSDRYLPITTFSFDLLCAFVGGAAVSIVVSFLLPALESLFDRTTDIKLLELSNNNVPILRTLALEAPGTYHHSVVVGSLAEAAAEAIGANTIFCRTAALYHDIGKLSKVDYFVENQHAGVNRHDRLSPRMSALIIASHVKEGIEMAKTIKLPPQIVDIIPQHHGTKLITYFYEKAKESQDPALGEVREAEFRYPGPKPQTKEAGIIMIADAVEAASRTLEDPSPARLKGVIRQIIDYIFLDGQLDECDLTLRDLERISQAFLRVLMGIYHHRISYPGFDFEKRAEPVVAQSGR